MHGDRSKKVQCMLKEHGTEFVLGRPYIVETQINVNDEIAWET